MKLNELGRSMVEMLGVLAIIGVLSVGALSGYSKAMMKYKLNKHAYQISQLINTMYQYQYEFHSNAELRSSLVPIFQKLNAIPDGMIPVENGTNSYKDVVYLKDAFGSYNAPFIQGRPYNEQTWLEINAKNYAGSYIVFPSMDIGIAYCRNILTALQPLYKENPQNFAVISLFGGTGKYIGLKDSKYDFANMTDAEITDICVQQLTMTEKIQATYHICFRNSR